MNDYDKKQNTRRDSIVRVFYIIIF